MVRVSILGILFMSLALYAQPGEGKENLQYIKSGSMIQDINTECNCLSSNMDDRKGSIIQNHVSINIVTLVGSNRVGHK